MLNSLNLYTLTFKDKLLELQYQSQSIQKTLKPFYYAILLAAMVMYSITTILTYLSLGKILYLNISIISICFMMLILIYKKDHQIQICMTIANLVILLQQINIANLTIDAYYQYMNGSLFAALQTGICFAIDFQYSFPAIVVHFIFRFIIQSYYVRSFDYMLFLMGFLTLFFISSVLYICNRAQRLQFLMNLKDDTITKQLETLINQPFAKIKYDKDKIKIDVLMAKEIEKFAGFSDELCCGCNIRNFMRSCKYNSQSIEIGLVDGMIPLNQSLTVIHNRQRILIRICDYSIDSSFILIHESSNKMTNTKSGHQIKQQLKENLQTCKVSKENQLYRFGVISILLMNHKAVRTINLIKMIKKLKHIYSCKCEIRMNEENEIKLRTYAYLFKIYFIQIFNILSELRKDSDSLQTIECVNFDICLVVKLKLSVPSSLFLKYYYQNFFICQFSELLLLTHIDEDLVFQFSKVLAFR